MATRKLTVEIVGDASKLKRELGVAQGATQRFGSRFNKLALAGGAVGAGLAAVGVGLKKTVDAAQESEKAQQRLQSAVKASGLSMDQYGKSIQDNINKTSQLAALDDEDLSDSFAKLVSVTKNVTEATKGMNLAADIARSRNISLEASTKMVERALAGNESAFSRIGLKLDKTATSQDVLAEAQKRFGGAAEDYGKTSAAAQERVGVAFENLQEIIGSKVLPVVAKLAEALVKFLDWAIVNWPRFSSAVGDAMDKAKAAFETVRPIVMAFKNVIVGLVNTIMAIFRGDWAEAWGHFKGVVSAALTAVKEMIQLAWEGVKKAATTLGEKIKDGVVAGVLGIGAAAWGVINNIDEFISDRVDQIKGWGKKVATWFVNALLDGFTGLGKKIWEAIKSAIEWVTDHMPSLPKLPSIDVPFIGGDSSNPSRTAPHSSGGNLMGASPVMAPFASAASALGLRVTSGLRPGAITANGTPSDHGIGKALDVAGSSAAMAAFFHSLVGNRAVKQAFYDPLGSIFGGAWSSYREGGHSDHVHVASYDKGGYLRPGWNLAYNGTGRPEAVGMAGNATFNIQLGGDHVATIVWDQVRQKAAVFEKQNNRSAF